VTKPDSSSGTTLAALGGAGGMPITTAPVRLAGQTLYPQVPAGRPATSLAGIMTRSPAAAASYSTPYFGVGGRRFSTATYSCSA
jgi:hypothetical protein